MNKVRRTALEDIKNSVEDIRDELEGLRKEEIKDYDNMPVGLRYGEKGGAAMAAIEQLYNAVEGLEEVTSHIEEALYDEK